jgi:hypothetical protein
MELKYAGVTISPLHPAKHQTAVNNRTVKAAPSGLL